MKKFDTELAKAPCQYAIDNMWYADVSSLESKNKDILLYHFMFGSDVTYLQSLTFIQPIMNISTQLGGFQKPDIFYKLLNEFMYQFPLKRMADFNLCQKSYSDRW